MEVLTCGESQPGYILQHLNPCKSLICKGFLLPKLVQFLDNLSFIRINHETGVAFLHLLNSLFHFLYFIE